METFVGLAFWYYASYHNWSQPGLILFTPGNQYFHPPHDF